MLVHNHPGGSSLSCPDRELAAKNGLRRIYAVANDKSMVYAATVDASSLPALPALHKAYDDRVFSVVIERVAAGTVPRHEVEKYHFHIVNALLHRARY